MVNNMSTLKQVYKYFKQRKKFWLIPFIIALLMLSVFILLAPTSPYAPFIYTLF
jgi:hypothetical protein